MSKYKNKQTKFDKKAIYAYRQANKGKFGVSARNARGDGDPYRSKSPWHHANLFGSHKPADDRRKYEEPMRYEPIKIDIEEMMQRHRYGMTQTPYLRDIIDVLGDTDLMNEVVVIKGQSMGPTSCNIPLAIGYLLQGKAIPMFDFSDGNFSEPPGASNFAGIYMDGVPGMPKTSPFRKGLIMTGPAKIYIDDVFVGIATNVEIPPLNEAE